MEFWQEFFTTEDTEDMENHEILFSVSSVLSVVDFWLRVKPDPLRPPFTSLT